MAVPSTKFPTQHPSASVIPQKYAWCVFQVMVTTSESSPQSSCARLMAAPSATRRPLSEMTAGSQEDAGGIC